jgi:transcriptional regulator with XRE-family HTH domain
MPTDKTLQTLRRAAGYPTQDDVAAATGMHKTTIARYEAGMYPMPEWLPLFYKYRVKFYELGIDPDSDFLDGDKKKMA